MSRRRAILASLFAVFLVAAILRSPINGLGPILDQISADYGLTATATGMLAAVPLLAFATVSPFAPGLARRVGLDRAIAVFVSAICLGIVLRVLPDSAALYGGTIVLSAGIAGVNVLLPAVVKRDFPDRVSAVTAAYTVVMMLFASLAAFTAFPLAEIVGWKVTVSAWLPLAGLAGIAWWVGSTRLAREGLESAGMRQRPSSRLPFRSPLAWFCTAYMGMQALGFFIVINWLPRTLSDLGIEPLLAATTPGIIQAGQIIAIAAMPVISRLVTHELARSLLAAGLLLVGYLGVLVNPAIAVLWCVLIGIGGGMSIVIALASFSLRTRTHTQAAALSGMSQAGGYLLASAGPPLFAALHSMTASWEASLWLLVATALAQGALSPLIARGFVPEHSFEPRALGTQDIDAPVSDTGSTG